MITIVRNWYQWYDIDVRGWYFLNLHQQILIGIILRKFFQKCNISKLYETSEKLHNIIFCNFMVYNFIKLQYKYS
jgi:hypothetical protein